VTDEHFQLGAGEGEKSGAKSGAVDAQSAAKSGAAARRTV